MVMLTLAAEAIESNIIEQYEQWNWEGRRYIGKTATNLNYSHEYDKIRLHSGNTFWHSVQNLWVFPSTYVNVKIKI
jgi:hypothetical protein